MKKEDKAKMRMALARVLGQLPAEVERHIPDPGPAEKPLRASMKTAGSDNEIVFLVDNSKAPHEGKYNFMIGVFVPEEKKLEAVHAVAGVTAREIIDFLRTDGLLDALGDRLEAVLDKNSA